MMDILLAILAIIFFFIGIAAAIYPIIPGCFFSFLGLLCVSFKTDINIAATTLIIWGVVMALCTLVDNIFSPILTRKYGGSKKAAMGSLIGLIIGSFFLPPFGSVIGTLAGAFIGQVMHSRKMDTSTFRAAWGAFLGFVISNGIKLAYSVVIIIYAWDMII